MSEFKDRDPYVDILKGIGIFSVVLGHAFNTDYYYTFKIDFIRRFVYIYHLAIFFWCSGYLFKKKKMKKFLKDSFKHTYLKSVFFAFFSLLFIPVLVKLGTMNTIEFKTLLNKCIRILCFHPEEGVLTGTLWFVPWLFFTDLILRLFVYFIEKFQVSTVFQIILVLLVGIFGIFLVKKNLFHQYYINLAVLFLPVIFQDMYPRNI